MRKLLMVVLMLVLCSALFAGDYYIFVSEFSMDDLLNSINEKAAEGYRLLDSNITEKVHGSFRMFSVLMFNEKAPN